mmetsp:Transcript_30287/g.56337  ORF Transcript_30287/g.56337 Transcript_30287/m.56337 type:complete len:481 (+) Transcript_30287:77-1519(+)
MALDYDNSAFYYFAITCLFFYLIPGSYYVISEVNEAFFAGNSKALTARTGAEATKAQKLKKNTRGFARLRTWTFIINLFLLVIAFVIFAILVLNVISNGEVQRFDPYQILGIDAETSTGEIKKAYRKLALKWHPDKNPDNQEAAQKKFQEVGNAFNVLSDPEKKKMYDQFGEAGENMEGPPPGAGGGGGMGGFPGGMGGMGGMGGGGGRTFHFTSGGGGGGGGMGGMDANDIFKSFFGTSDPFAAGGGDDPFGGMGGGGGGGAGFSPFGMGGMGGMQGGMGGMNAGMGGRGGGMSERPRTLRKSEPISYDLGVNLDDLYTGKLKKVRITKKVADEASGRIEQKKVDKEIHIRPGWKDGTKITFERAGDELPGIQPADIIFVVRTRPHDFFERDGDDLIYNCPITLQQALCGFSTSVRTLDDRVLPIRETSATPQTVKIIPGEGMPNQKTKAKGNLKIKYSIQFPELSQSKRTRIGEVLSE